MPKLVALLFLVVQAWYGPAAAQTKPMAVNTPRPEYKADLARSGAAGLVKVRIVVAPDGTTGTSSLAASSGFVALDEHVVGTVRTWTFVAATDATGKKIASELLVDFVFRLEDKWDRPAGGSISTLSCREAHERSVAESSAAAPQSKTPSLESDAKALVLASAPSAEGKAAIERVFGQVFRHTLQECGSVPTESFMKTLQTRLIRAGA